MKYQELIECVRESLANQDFIKLEVKPNQSCNKCYGRGYVGYIANKKDYMICKCLIKQIKQHPEYKELFK